MAPKDTPRVSQYDPEVFEVQVQTLGKASGGLESTVEGLESRVWDLEFRV